MRLRQQTPEPAPLRLTPATPVTAETPLARHVPTFRNAGRTLGRVARRRPKLTRRRAAVLLAAALLVGVRWVDANQEPSWPTFTPTYPGATVGGVNAAHLYHAATEAFVDEGPRYLAAQKALPAGLPPWGDLTDTAAPMALKRAAAADNAAALRWLSEASEHGYAGNFDGRWLKTRVPTSPSLSSPVPNFILIRQLSRTAGGSCDALAADGRADLAVDRALDVAQWGVNLTHDPTLIEGMIGVLIQGIGWNKALEHAGALTPAQAEAALARLERLPQPAGFDALVRHEEAFGASMFRDLFQTGDTGAVTGLSRVAGRAAQDAMVLWYTKRGLVQNFTDVMEQYARLGAMPYRTAAPLTEALQQRVENGTGLNWFTRIAVPNFLRAREAYEIRNASRERLRARLALSVWRARHGGASPASLDALVDAGLLTRVPIDPFSVDAAAPLRYNPSTGTVWSVGKDGVDSGGAGDDTLKL